MTATGILLLLGFVALGTGIGLGMFPIIGLVGIVLVLAALVLLVAAGILAGYEQCDGGSSIPCKSLDCEISSTSRTVPGLTLFIVGLMGVVAATGQATATAYEHARYVQLSSAGSNISPPTTSSFWLSMLLWMPVASLLLALGIGLRRRWSLTKVGQVAALSLCVCPLAVAVFYGVAQFWPLDA